MCVLCHAAITLSKWDLLEQKRKEEEEASRKQASYDDIDGRSVLLIVTCCSVISRLFTHFSYQNIPNTTGNITYH